jgi:hypothetical protein
MTNDELRMTNVGVEKVWRVAEIGGDVHYCLVFSFGSVGDETKIRGKGQV